MIQAATQRRKGLIALVCAGLFLVLTLFTYSIFPASISSSLHQLGKQEPSGSDAIDWSRFAYVQYVTTLPYLCNSLMLFERLKALGSKPNRLLMYPRDMSPENNDVAGVWLKKARDEYNVILKPIEIQKKQSNDPTWAESFTKLLAFNQTEYERVLHVDSDSTILKDLDELFHLPPAIVAMPRSYWEAQEPHIKLSSQILLATPSKHQFERCEAAIESAKADEYDMEILNNLYRDSALVLPHKIYDLYTREFRQGPNHTDYIGADEGAIWNADEAIDRAKFLHFSDWPLPKPWLEASDTMWKQNMPPCFQKDGSKMEGDSETLCRERELWVGFYKDFRDRRSKICGNET